MAPTLTLPDPNRQLEVEVGQIIKTWSMIAFLVVSMLYSPGSLCSFRDLTSPLPTGQGQTKPDALSRQSLDFTNPPARDCDAEQFLACFCLNLISLIVGRGSLPPTSSVFSESQVGTEQMKAAVPWVW